MYKYTLIISQYYYSRHYFIVHHTEDFIEKAREFAKELMAYKRDADNERVISLGDLGLRYVGNDIRQRYNINDSGDIYFLQSDYANRLAAETWSYKEDTRRESRGFQKKEVTRSISEHHDYKKVAAIVEKYFVIA